MKSNDLDIVKRPSIAQCSKFHKKVQFGGSHTCIYRKNKNNNILYILGNTFYFAISMYQVLS